MRLFAAYMVAGLALLLLQMPAISFADDDVKHLRLITVKGEAKAQLVPDQAIINLEINGKAVKLSQAKNQHDVRLKRLLTLLHEHGVADRKIRTQHTNTQPIYQYDHKKQQQIFEAYLVQSQLAITVEDTDKLGALLEDLNRPELQEEGQRYGAFLQMQYGFSNPEALRDKLLAKAIDNARVKARRMASAAGADLGRVHRIYEQSTNYGQPYYGRVQAKTLAATAEVAPTPPAGEQEITAQVNVTFELK